MQELYSAATKKVPGKTFQQLWKDNKLDICRQIIEKLHVKNPADINDITPLHVAAMKGHLEICHLILENLEDGLDCLLVEVYLTYSKY